MTVCDDVNKAWDNLKLISISALDSLAPVKSGRIKQRTADWVESEVLECIKLRLEIGLFIV